MKHACNWLSERVWETKAFFQQYDLHKFAYQELNATFFLCPFR
jgi:hypothetical protein